LTIDLVENLGDETLLYTRSPDGQTINMSLAGQQIIFNGSTIPAHFDIAHCHVFGPDGRAI
jgi:multiple sugar transport system ATP-binding protein